MNLKEIFSPIINDLTKVEGLLQGLAQSCSDQTREIISAFFEGKGKLLRPALVIFSARAANASLTAQTSDQLIKLAAAIELIHSASLIHDDVIDEDLYRRKHKTLNSVFGNKIAVIAGDLLFTQAFFMLSNNLSPEYSNTLANLTETMCSAEIEQLRTIDGAMTKKNYLRIIQGKTASFMSVCCKLGALLAVPSDTNTINHLESFGLNLGMVYQLKDDQQDKALANANFDVGKTIETYSQQAIIAAGNLNNSIYRDHLLNLLHLIKLDKHNE